MRFRWVYFWILLVVGFLSLLGSYLYWKDEIPLNRVLIFVTVGIDESQHPEEVSSYELQRASEHFSDVILGWTLEPHFREDFLSEAGTGYTFTGQRQEKQNLLFVVTNTENNIAEHDVFAGEAFLRVLNAQLQDYNASTHQGYVLAVQNLSYEPGAVSHLPVLGAVLFFLTLTGAGLLTYEYAQTCRRS